MSFAISRAFDELSRDGSVGGAADLPPRLPSNREIVELCQAVDECPAHIVVLGAECGMGKTHALNCFASDEEERGSVVLRISLAFIGESEAASRITRFAREVVARCASNVRVVVTIDDVPGGDERSVAREARAIRKITQAGGFVAVGLRPEAYALAEELEGAAVFGSSHLAACACPADDLVFRLTNGVPQLVTALETDGMRSARALGRGRSYLDALNVVVLNSLRPTLPEEDVNLRLAMALLGSGTFDDLRAVVDRLDMEMLAWLEREAPLFGCSCAMREFSVARPSGDDYLIDVFGSLAGVCSTRGRLVSRCSDVLAMRGEYRRSGLVRSLCDDTEDPACLSTEWDLDYICAGLPRVVTARMEARRSALEGEADARATPVMVSDAMSICAIGEMSERRPELARRRKRVQRLVETSGAPAGALRRLSLLSARRDILAEVPSAVVVGVSIDDDRFSAQLVTHICVVRDLASGRISDAFGRLVNDQSRNSVDGLPAAWLHDDFHVCEVLLGERDTAFEDEGSACADRVFATVGSKRLRLYRSSMREVLKVAMGRSSSFEGAEKAISCAGEYGDALMEAVFLSAAAVADLRAGAFKRSHVRAGLARERALVAGSDYLADVARLIQVGVEARLGESISSAEEEMGDGAIKDLCRMFRMASSVGRKRAVRLECLRRTSCPRDVLWALNFLLFDCGDASRAFERELPGAWRGLVRIVFGDGADAPEGPEGMSASTFDGGVSTDARTLRDDIVTSQRVRVSVLGTLAVSVGGKLVAPNELARRRAHDLIAVLAAAPGHKMSKLELIEAIWGDCDYVSGLQKLYEATAAARKILRGGDADANPVISSRYSGSVALNANEIAFDADEFRGLATLALMSEGGDRNTMRYAVEADRMYSGGVSHELPDVNGVFAAERDALAKAHVDSNVAGSIAALREGKAYLAVDLARSALVEDGLREDAMKCLASALATQGRRAEIISAYKDYRWRLRKELGVRPSGDVRRHVENALRDAEIGDGGVEAKDNRLNAGSNGAEDGAWQAAGEGLVEHGDGVTDALIS